MPFPAGATTITVTINRPIPAGGAGNAGRIIFTPSTVLVDATHKAIYSGAGTATLDANGTATIQLLTTDATGVLPAGWQWQIDEQLPGARRTYYINLPSTLGATVDLSQLSPVSAPNGAGQSLPPTGPAGGALTGSFPNPLLSAATIASFDAAGSASTAQTAAVFAAATDATAKVQAHTTATDPHGDRAYADSSKLSKTANLSDLGDINTARTNLGLGSAATQNTSAFDTAGAAAAAQAAAITNAASTYMPLTGGTFTGDVTFNGRLSQNGLYLPLIAPSGRRPVWRTATWSQQFQTGHGWTVGGAGTASSNVNDTTQFVRGTQSVSVVTAGNGVQSQVRKLSQPAMDLTGKMIRLILRVDDVTHLNRIEFLVGTSTFTNFYRWTAHTHSAVNPNYMQSGEWVTIHLNWADVSAAGGTYSINANGTPSSTTGFTDMQINCYDDAAGSVTYRVQAVELVPDTSTTFPNGVVSITFDDSYQSVYDLARPIMDGLGYRGTMYNIAQAIGSSNVYLTVPEMLSMQNFSGWEMGGHAYATSAHTAGYNQLTAQQVSDDFRNLRAWMVSNGFTSEHFAYPKGHFEKTLDGVPVDQLATQYFTTARSIISETVESFAPAMAYRLKSTTGINDGSGLGGVTITSLTAAGGPLDRCVNNSDWLILCFHKLVTGTPADSTEISQAGFQTVMNAISSRGIPVVPIGEVLRYYT